MVLVSLKNESDIIPTKDNIVKSDTEFGYLCITFSNLFSNILSSAFIDISKEFWKRRLSLI